MVSWVILAAVFVNGVQVEPRQLAGESLRGVDVRVDDRGDVHIDAPGYSLRRTGEPAPSSAGWWLLVENGGLHGVMVDVYVNDQLAWTVSDGGENRLVDIGSLVRPGENAVRVVSRAAEDRGGDVQVALASGISRSGAVVLDVPQVAWQSASVRAGTETRHFVLHVGR